MNPFNLTWVIDRDIPVIYLEGDITSESDLSLKDAYNEIKKKEKCNYALLFFIIVLGPVSVIIYLYLIYLFNL